MARQHILQIEPRNISNNLHGYCDLNAATNAFNYYSHQLGQSLCIYMHIDHMYGAIPHRLIMAIRPMQISKQKNGIKQPLGVYALNIALATN